MKFVDTEQMVRVFLRARTADTIEVTVPEDRSQFTQVLRTGGTAVNRVLERAQFTIRGWGVHRTDAQKRAARARHALMNEYALMPLVRGVNEVQGITRNPDPESGQERYEFTVELMIRATRP